MLNSLSPYFHNEFPCIYRTNYNDDNKYGNNKYLYIYRHYDRNIEHSKRLFNISKQTW